MSDGPRYGIYWAPAQDDALWVAGAAWLGRDPAGGTVSARRPAVAEPDAITEAPRLYGFHATLKPPMRLSTGWDDVVDTAERLATSLQPFDAPPLMVTDLDGFLAIVPASHSPALQALADACVRATDPHRLQPSQAELARRRAAGLSSEEEQLLQRWGYPYVMQRWRFHMTLSRRLSPPDIAAWRKAADHHFAAALASPRRITHIAMFTQRAPETPFLITHRLKLGR